MKTFFSAVSLGLAMAVGAALPAHAQQAAGQQAAKPQMKAVYHINDSKGQALAALRNMRNHLDVAPDTKIVAVAHSDGIDFLAAGYEDNAQVGPLISGLAARGVTFEVCEITIKRKQLSQDDFVLEADFTPSGVVRLTQLQAEGHSYVKP